MIYTFVFFGLLIVGIKFVQILAAFEGAWGTTQWLMAAAVPVIAVIAVFAGIKLYKDSKKAKEENAKYYDEMLEKEKQRKRELYLSDFETPAEVLETSDAELNDDGEPDEVVVTALDKAEGDSITRSESAAEDPGEKPEPGLGTVDIVEKDDGGAMLVFESADVAASKQSELVSDAEKAAEASASAATPYSKYDV